MIGKEREREIRQMMMLDEGDLVRSPREKECGRVLAHLFVVLKHAGRQESRIQLEQTSEQNEPERTKRGQYYDCSLRTLDIYLSIYLSLRP